MVRTRRPPAIKAAYPVRADMLPAVDVGDRRYAVRYARTAVELAEIQRLRFDVFNVELGEGLQESFRTGRDEDRFDPVCHHLIVAERASGAIIGTYRMQTAEMAREHGGFYSAGEFDLAELPVAVVEEAVEIGRACIAREHRNRKVLFLLWRGLAAYMTRNRKKYLFGCCSLTSQDPAEGKRVMDYLVAHGHARSDLPVRPLPDWECYGEGQTYDPRIEAEIPRLFRLYLRYGAKACGPPAIDRFFKTIDYFVLINVEELDRDLYRLFFD